MTTPAAHGPEAQDDEQLVAAFTAGDQEAFDVLVSRYERRVFAICYRYFGNVTDAEDAALRELGWRAQPDAKAAPMYIAFFPAGKAPEAELYLTGTLAQDAAARATEPCASPGSSCCSSPCSAALSWSARPSTGRMRSSA